MTATGPGLERALAQALERIDKLEARQTVQPARHARQVAGGGGIAGLCLVRGWPTGGELLRRIDCSMVVESDDDLWQVLTNDSVELFCQPSMKAERDYKIFQTILLGETFPHVLTDEEAGSVLPVFRVGSRRVVWAIPAFGVPADLDAEMPTTEGRPEGGGDPDFTP